KGPVFFVLGKVHRFIEAPFDEDARAFTYHIVPHTAVRKLPSCSRRPPCSCIVLPCVPVHCTVPGCTRACPAIRAHCSWQTTGRFLRSEEHTSELQSRFDLVCRLLLEKKNHT